LLDKALQWSEELSVTYSVQGGVPDCLPPPGKGACPGSLTPVLLCVGFMPRSRSNSWFGDGNKGLKGF